MPTNIICPQCGLKMHVYRGAGPKIQCPSCGKRLQLIAPVRRNQDAPATGEWYYRVMGVEVGPLSFKVLKQHFRAKKLGPDAEVRMGSQGRWVLAETVRGLPF